MINVPRTQQLEARWIGIESRYRLTPYTTPLNLAEEKQKFLTAYHAGTPYNPQFTYRPTPDFPFQEIEVFLSQLRSPDNPLEEAYKRLAEQELILLRSLEVRTPAAITSATTCIYGTPDKHLLATAKQLLKQKHTDSTHHGITEEITYSASFAAAYLQKTLVALGVQEWNAIVHDTMHAKMAVLRLDKELRVRAEARFTAREIQRLMIHEIGVHIFRNMNGAAQPLAIFALGFPCYGSTEEGLAVYSEEYVHLLDYKVIRKYAVRVIAAHMALSNSFWEIFIALAGLLDPTAIFDIVARSKRGFSDTSASGAHTKDIIYLKGYIEVSDHLHHYPEDYPLLFAGKIGVPDLPLVKALAKEDQITHPRYLPSQILQHLERESEWNPLR